jgi:hypothetical protein
MTRGEGLLWLAKASLATTEGDADAKSKTN